MRKTDITWLTRRGFVGGLIAVPGLGRAHGGHGPARISAEAEVLRVKDRVVTVRLTLVNTASTPVALYSVHTEGAGAVVMSEPFEIGGFGVGEIEVDLVFETDVPGIFTATLDFGHHAQGPVTVMP